MREWARQEGKIQKKNTERVRERESERNRRRNKRDTIREKKRKDNFIRNTSPSYRKKKINK